MAQNLSQFGSTSTSQPADKKLKGGDHQPKANCPTRCFFTVWSRVAKILRGELGPQTTMEYPLPCCCSGSCVCVLVPWSHCRGQLWQCAWQFPHDGTSVRLREQSRSAFTTIPTRAVKQSDGKSKITTSQAVNTMFCEQTSHDS